MHRVIRAPRALAAFCALSLPFYSLADEPRGDACPADWLPAAGAPGVVGDATVLALTTWDPDGAGPQAPLLVAGGTLVGAGGTAARAVAAWDGAAWRSLGDGLNAQVRALTTFNGDLIAAAGHNGFGNPLPANGVARWNGTDWQPLGAAGFQNVVMALTVFNGELIAGGIFNSADGNAAANIARWDGATWRPLGSIPGGVTALTVFDGQLLAGSSGVLRWTGASWTSFGPNLTGSVRTFATYNGELIVGGSFRTSPGGQNEEVARWDGVAWQPLGGGMNDGVSTLIEYNGELIAGGLFTLVEGVSSLRLARWNGSTWAPVPVGRGMPVRRADSLAVFNGELYVGGAQTEPSGLQSEHVGRWDGAQWSYVGTGFDEIVYNFETFDGELIAAGLFSTAGAAEARGLARRDAFGEWHAFGDVSGADGFVFELTAFDDGLIVSGSFTEIGGIFAPGIALWTGDSWQNFGSTSIGRTLIHDGVLYATGAFGPSQSVARWDTATQSWQPIGTFPPNSGAAALTFFEGDLIAGGLGMTASVWRWDFDNPGTWQPVGQHLGFSTVQTLAAYNGELLAGGYSDGFGGPPGGLARFDGTSWVPLGGGLFLGNESPDEILAVFDLRIYRGELIVAGAFSYAGAQQYSPDAVAAYHVARWNGANWLPLGNGTDNAVVTLHEHNRELQLGGWFRTAGPRPSAHWARWGPHIAADLDGDLDVDIADLAVLLAHFGQPQDAQPADGDLDGDGDVDLQDLAALLSAFGMAC